MFQLSQIVLAERFNTYHFLHLTTQKSKTCAFAETDASINVLKRTNQTTKYILRGGGATQSSLTKIIIIDLSFGNGTLPKSSQASTKVSFNKFNKVF